MEVHQPKLHHLVHIFVAVLTLVSPLVPAAIAYNISDGGEESSTTPSDQINLLDSEIPVTQLLPIVDPTEQMLAQALGGYVDTLPADTTGLEPFGDRETSRFSTVAFDLPVLPNPIPQLPKVEQPTSLASINDGASPTNSENVASLMDELNGSIFAPARNQAVVQDSLVAEDSIPLAGQIEFPEIATDEVAFDFYEYAIVTPQTAVRATNVMYSTYLPIIAHNAALTSTVTPTTTIPTSDSITVTPEDGGILRSTDGLVELRVPADAVTEPVIITYIPPQSLLGGYWTLDAVTLDGQSVELQRSAELRYQVIQNITGEELFFRHRAHGQATRSIAAYMEKTTGRTMSESESAVTLKSSIYNFGQFISASMTEDDGPDEGHDGYVITQFCREQEAGEIFGHTYIQTTTQALAPDAILPLNWNELIDGEIEPQSASYLALEGDYSQDPDRVDLKHEPALDHPLGRILTGTLTSYERSNPGGLRWDELTDLQFQGGTTGCLSGNCEAEAPVIGFVDIWQSGQEKGRETGTAIIKAYATDNTGEQPSVRLAFNNVSYQLESQGNGLFVIEVPYPINGINNYEITAIDSCQNEATFPTISAHSSASTTFGWQSCNKQCGYQTSSIDPVNTANGNFYDQDSDIVVSGVGGADIVNNRAYNSMSALWTGGATMRYTVDNNGNLNDEQVDGPPQYYGAGWTFPFAVHLTLVNAEPFTNRAQVTYPDGHTATFVQEGDRYVSTSALSFDTLTLEGDEYVLLYKTTLDKEVFDLEGRLIRKEDRNGNTITLIYDGELLTRVENDSGRWLAFEYEDGFIKTITAPEERTIQYGYTDDLLTTVTDGNGHTTTYKYNDNQQLTEVLTPEGHHALEQIYDEEFRVDWQRIGRAQINDFEYEDDVTRIIDSYGNTTTYIYNEFAQIVAQIDARGFREEYDYNENYNRSYFKDREGREWSWTYDEKGNRLTEEGPLGSHREWAYNVLNRMTYMQDALERETFYGYDDVGNLTDITNAISGTSEIIYDGHGLPTHISDFNGNETVNVYDPITRDLVSTTNGADDTTEYGYDELGRMVSMTNGRNFTYTYSYDDADNLTDIYGPLDYHVQYRFDDNDNLEMAIDANDGETEYVYDHSEKVVRIENQLDFPTQFEYDDNNNLTKLIDSEGREWGL